MFEPLVYVSPGSARSILIVYPFSIATEIEKKEALVEGGNVFGGCCAAGFELVLELHRIMRLLIFLCMAQLCTAEITFSW